MKPTPQVPLHLSRTAAFVLMLVLSWGAAALNAAQQPVTRIFLRKKQDLYFLCIDFDKTITFTPRIHTLPNGVKILLSFNSNVMVPGTKSINHPIIKGCFFERFSPSSLMFVVATNENVAVISKKYTKNSISICFQIKKKHTIVIDAGHGGRDPGTRGVLGHYEKNITLISAIELRNLLVKSDKYKVILTRDRDISISLDERKQKITSSKADFFISLHTDSNDDKNLRGISIYTLSYPDHIKNTTDTNGTSLGFLLQSRRFAEYLIKYIPNACQIKNRPCRNSELKILRADMPAVLIELGCISNKIDDELLHSQDFRKKIIEAIKYALDDFFKKEK
ncbi:MAG: N-acetylmuramoyl-L-alanine amidase [Holosporaceae bacterium]|jgi:N-acetylmuramoyl-L-alanine amidase|nr:N-acetylmuramoyl-L-alanine amidase [Holosporaceae bacterium]